MAEFKLGRIKFVYQGAWTTGTPYVIDDIVSVGGKTYICVASHTASAEFSTDLNHNPTYWNVVADGQNWRGVWTASTPYQIGDQVQYGGTVYVCNTAHTSASYTAPTWLGLENDQSKWTVFAKAFSWAGQWATSTRYRVRDIVYYGGTTYVCNTAHISASTASSGLENDSAKWDIFNQGFVYVGDWADATRYKLNDVVKYGADLWICTTQHTSSGTLDTGNFQVFVNGFQFENSWNNSTTYQLGDVVAYGGYTYIATQNNSNQTPSTATSYWQPFTTGFKLQGDWSSSTSYKVGDVVRLGGYTYVAILDNSVKTVTATATIASTDLTNPNQVVIDDSSKLALNLPITFSGTTFGGITSGVQYYVKSIVDSTHITLSATSGGTTLVLTTGSGSSTGTTNSAPPYSTYWNKLSSGIRWNATGSTYTNVSGTNIVGTGVGATFDITRSGTSYTATVHAGSAGSGYNVNDTIKILGSSLGGLTPSNDLTLTVTGVTSNAVSTVSTSGFAVTWTSGTVYVQGDAVYYGPNTYICVTSHVGASGNKPDADTTGAYWNILALGAESASLTTQGDMFYFGNNGPQRLPIGTDGQVLRVQNNAPVWAYYGLINNVVYVAPTGTDAVGAGQGQTIDKPWKTIKFAAEQVELGHLNVNAYNLIAKNKQFIIKEVNNYIKNILTVSVTNTSNSDNSFTVASTANLYVGMPISFTGTGGGVTAGTTYYVYSIISETKFAISSSYNGSIFGVTNGGTNTGSYVYDQTKTERDTGILVDAIVYDLGHNGNAQTTAAALAYYSKTTATSYVAGVGAYDISAFVKAQSYMNTLIGNILANTAPAANYQALNGVSSGNRAVQIIDTTLTAESSAATTVSSLIAIVSNGISVGSSTGIATGVNGNTTISTKTGTYNEILPIVVNKNTAIVGDELRSTVIQPAAANLNLVGDKPKTISALNRIKVLIPDLISNTTITPTTGNTQTQVTTLPAGSVGSTTAITNLTASADVIYDVVNNGLGTEPSFVMPAPTGYNTASLTDVAYACTGNATGDSTGYGDGKAQIVQNYAFIKDEVSSWLANPSNGFDTMWAGLGATAQAKCLRDVGYILDALQYDMTYGGNFQTLIAGSSYYSNYVSTIQSSERQGILSVYNWLKSFIDNIVLKDTAGWTKTTSLSQVITGTAGSTNAATFAQARIQDIIDWITNGYAPSSVSPATSWTSSALQTSFAALQAKKTEIQLDTVAWVKKFYQHINFDSTLCSRDAGLIVDALSYDMIFGSNLNAITAGRSYLRLTSSALNVYTNQKAAELGSIKFIKDKSRIIAAAGASAQIQTIIDDITATIAGGATPRITWTNPSTITTAYAASAVLLADNKEFIKAEIQAYLNSTAPYSTTWSTLTATQKATCARDVGYIVDALVYDLKYGGSFATKQAGQAYYSYSTLEIAAGEKASMLASLTRLSTVAQAIIQNNAVSVSTGNTATQIRANGAQSVGGSTQATQLNALVTIAYNIVNSGLTSGVQTVTITTIATNNTFTTSAAHGLNVGDLVIPQSTANGLTSGTTYYVASTPLTTTFTLSATYGGTVLASFTNGTGLSIVAEITNEPGTAWVSSTLVAGYTALSTAKSSLQTAVSNYIATNYPTLTYNSATCLRDVGLIIDAVGYDMMMGSNFRSIKAGQSYFRAQAALVVGAQKAATIAAFTYLQSQIYTTLSTNATAQTAVNGLMSTVINIIAKGDGVVPEISGTNTYNNTLDVIKGAEILRANANFLAYEAAAWTDATFGGYVTTTAGSGNLITTSAPHGFVVGDPVIFTAPTVTTTATSVSGNNITVSSSTGILPGMPIVFGSNLGNLVLSTTYYVLTASAGVLTVSSTYNGSTFDAGTASGTASVTAGGTFGGLTTSTTYYVLTAPSTTTFTITTTQSNTSQTVVSLSNGNGLMTVKYSYNLASCVRDTKAFINALVYDLNFTGNYKTNRAAVLYNNAVSGSAYSDMFLLRNATGIRNCTMTGLNGTLTNVNAYNTKRPTGGSFSSLDPGFGPNDSSVWITARSPYTQNCTMFGTACTGVKIDGALHTGGNKSIVANDYTTIISDGIGAWCTGTGSLTELVSVFNYYGYSGYLAELGGRIRATNGNSSYGTYGVIAEGVDSYETPIYGTVNNRNFQASITNVVTDGINQILRLEYQNAGTNYTNSTPTISGSGYNINVTQDEFRDAGLFESRIIDLNNGQGTGGSYYVTASNTAQAGNTTQITIAATDIALSSAYIGMRVQLIAGTGAGQYANILSYNNGTKVALVTKDSFTNLTVTATTASSDLITVASTASLYANMPIYFGSAVGGIAANTLYYVKTISSATQFTISATSGGTTFDVTSDTAAQSVTLYAAGWDHCVPGTTISAVLDLSSQYVIEPRVSYTGPGYTATSRTLSASATWSALAAGDSRYVAVASGGTATSYSTDGKTWTAGGALPTSSTWNDVVYGGGSGALATATVGGLGGAGATFTATIGTGANATQIVAITVTNGGYGYSTPPVISISGGGGIGATATCTVLNGAIQTVTMTINGSGYNAQPTITAITDTVTALTPSAWGKNYTTAPTVTVSAPFSGSAWAATTGVSLGTYIYYNNSGTINWYSVTGAGTTGAVAPTHTSGSASNGSATLTYAGTTATGTANLTNGGVSSITIGTAGKGYTSTPTVTIVDSTAKFVAIRSGATPTSAYSTVANLGSAWTNGNALPTGDLAALAYGGGFYVAVGGTSGTASAASSTDGITWVNRSSAISALSGSSTYTAITYGAGVFMAIATGTNVTTYSTSGVSWSLGGTLPSSATWTSIAFGNNRFIVLAATGAIAYSINNGASWIAPAISLSSTYTWSKIAYGQGLFFAIATGTNVCATSPDGINWTYQVLPASSNWKSIVFGTSKSATLGTLPLWVAISNTSGTVAASVRTGATPLGRIKVVSNAVNETRIVEPGSGFPKGNVTATTTSTNVITTDDTTNLIDSQPVMFTGLDSYGLTSGTTYYIIGSTIVSNTSFKVSATAGSATAVNLTTGSGLTGTYRAGPIITQTDPNKVNTANLIPRTGDGVLANPTYVNRGSGNQTATASTIGDGYADLYQPGSFINIAGLFAIPQAGANVEFSTISGVWYKLVQVTNVLGSAGNYTGQFQISPALTVLNAPAHGTRVTTRLKYSQVRLTGHDFLYIGVGNYTQTNYPNVDASKAIQSNQTVNAGGGRVFFTATDQDGNFNVGNLFGVQQATGTATLNASAFNIAGLQSLTLGSVSLGVGSATITSFSTDPYFTANSDNILPTQRAIKSYITSQIGGGLSTLNVNTLTAGVIYIANNTITTTTGGQINVNAKMNFTGGIDGAPVALVWFGQR